MDLINKKVEHITFGKGNVINCDDSYIEISFKSGDKKFSFPSVFKEYVTFVDETATSLVNKKIEKEEEELRKEEIILEKERALELELRYIANQKTPKKSKKIHAKTQSVFWAESEEEEEEIFKEWKVFTGEIKSGKKKGQPRLLPRMSKNSACLITRRTEDMAEGDRQVLGMFMANEFFDGRLCEDGYITAHPKHRIHLSEKEVEKVLFWDYYFDNKSEDETIWKSGRQRYFDNIWMAQILRDIINIRKEDESDEKVKEAEEFFDYFCMINAINKNEIPEANGALKRK